MEEVFRNWQKEYHRYPYSERHGLPPEGYAPMMMDVFQSTGIIDDTKEREMHILASSVSSGRKDIAFMRELDKHLSTLEKFHRPKVIFTDFAYEDPGPGKVGTPVIKMPKEPLKNIDLQAITCDMFRIPLETNSVDVLYEQLGALWHAGSTDRWAETDGEYVRKIIDEYKRVVAPGGKIIIDRGEPGRGDLSTAREVTGYGGETLVRDYFEKFGFKVGFTENHVVLTTPAEET